MSREPLGFDFKELQLQLGLPPSAAATVPGFNAQETGWNLWKCQSWGPIFGDGVRSQLLIKLNSDGVFW